MKDTSIKAAFRYLDEQYHDSLQFLNVTKNSKKMIIFFSGKSGVGKSTLAQYLSEKLCAIRLENDLVRKHILDFYYGNIALKDSSQMMWDYVVRELDRLNKDCSNKLWIRDAMIDHYYPFFFNYCKENDIDTFIIGFQLSEELNRKQIIDRGNFPHVTVKTMLGELGEKQSVWQSDFLQHHTPDYIFTDKNHGDYREVLQLIKERYQNL